VSDGKKRGESKGFSPTIVVRKILFSLGGRIERNAAGAAEKERFRLGRKGMIIRRIGTRKKLFDRGVRSFRRSVGEIGYPRGENPWSILLEKKKKQ